MQPRLTHSGPFVIGFPTFQDGAVRVLSEGFCAGLARTRVPPPAHGHHIPSCAPPYGKDRLWSSRSFPTSSSPSRRTIVTGAAWSVPVIMTAAAAPAFAASRNSCRTAYLDWGTATSTKLTNGTVYTITGTQTVYAQVTYTESAGAYSTSSNSTANYQLRIGKRAFGEVGQS